jgi:Domain of unknown function (DUF3291)
LPDPQEGRERLEYLREHGDTPYAFSFKHVFPEPLEIDKKSTLPPTVSVRKIQLFQRAGIRNRSG